MENGGWVEWRSMSPRRVHDTRGRGGIVAPTARRLDRQRHAGASDLPASPFDCAQGRLRRSSRRAAGATMRYALSGAFQAAFCCAGDFFQRQRVTDGVCGVIVVEVDVGGFQRALPIVESVGPLLELFVGVAALVFE